MHFLKCLSFPFYRMDRKYTTKSLWTHIHFLPAQDASFQEKRNVSVLLDALSSSTDEASSSRFSGRNGYEILDGSRNKIPPDACACFWQMSKNFVTLEPKTVSLKRKMTRGGQHLCENICVSLLSKFWKWNSNWSPMGINTENNQQSCFPEGVQNRGL